MKKWLKVGALLLGLLVIPTASALTWRTQEPQQIPVVIYTELLSRLDSIAEHATKEHVRCLIGLIREDSVIIEEAYEPRIFSASENNVSYNGCARASIGLWHNHLPWITDSVGERHPVPPVWKCMMSDADKRTGDRMPWAFIHIIHVDKETMCWWVRMPADGVYLRLYVKRESSSP